MNKTSDKIKATVIVGFIAIIWFILTPLWVGICFVMPGFFLLLKYALSQNLSLSSHDSSKSSLLKSDSNTRTTFQKNGYNNSSRRFGVNCTSLTDRKNKYGF